VVFDRDTSWRFPLPRDGEIVLGRADGVGLQLLGAAVSRQHARLTVSAGVATIADLGSHNGVSINGDRIAAPHVLKPSDMISIGEATLLYHGPAEPTAADPGGEVRRVTIGEATVIIADPAMLRLYALLERLAGTELPIVIAGETGAGKELAAASVHHWSPRADKPFVALNCATVPENLAESELFGHEKGSFSGAAAVKVGLLEAAAGGTVFLDEIGELSLAVQAKLLRVLETQKVMRLGAVRERDIDMRIVAASNRDLETEVRAGRFREDLFYRLCGATVWLPPLRDRPRELPLLAQAFLDGAARAAGRGPMTISPDAHAILAAHRWPGNIRELRNTMAYLAAAVTESRVEARHLPAQLNRPAAPAAAAPAATFRSLDDELQALERQRMEAALAECKGNQTRAAALIGMPRRTFVHKLKQYGIGKKDE
jgi:DNA-binding NtrC family response regulator